MNNFVLRVLQQITNPKTAKNTLLVVSLRKAQYSDASIL
jgi:hypothetical protein